MSTLVAYEMHIEHSSLLCMVSDCMKQHNIAVKLPVGHFAGIATVILPGVISRACAVESGQTAEAGFAESEGTFIIISNLSCYSLLTLQIPAGQA